jgi:hypothetical protein
MIANLMIFSLAGIPFFSSFSANALPAVARIIPISILIREYGLPTWESSQFLSRPSPSAILFFLELAVYLKQ